VQTPKGLKQRLFVEHYLGDAKGNATEAARRAGYAPRYAREIGGRLLHKPHIAAAIEARIAEVAMTSAEVLGRMSDLASSTLEDFLDLSGETPSGAVSLAKAKRLGRIHTLKKLKWTENGPEIELHAPFQALDKLGQYYGLWDRAKNATTLNVSHELVWPDANPDAAPAPGAAASEDEPGTVQGAGVREEMGEDEAGVGPVS
jgi:hypothetical protein